jgi:NB-ARC domain
MNVNDMLQFVDRLVLEKTGKHLDDVQKAVIEGTWQRQSYDDIAQKCNVTEGYIGDVGSELWQILSEIFNEDIKKTNFRSTLERINIKSVDNSLNVYNIKSSNNHFCHTQTFNHPNKQNKESNTNTKSKLIYHDLKLAPKISRFGDRTELQTLSNWICQGERPFTPTLISILGLSGIGKTTLVKRFVDLNLDQFEVIIWRTLKFPKSLDLLINDLLKVCQQEPQKTLPDKLTELFDIFNEKKCLIILDDLQNIFITGEFTGQYKPEFQDYQNFFTMITETEHQSNVILISQEICAEMQILDENLAPINCIELSGLDHTYILQNTGLNHQDSWLKLIELYESNPFYLKEIALLIKDIFDSNVAEFLAENNLIITNKMRSLFNQLFHRLSPIEQKIVLKLSQTDQPITREELKEHLEISPIDFSQGLPSLQQRYLVSKIKEDKTLFTLSPVFKEYVRNYCKD